MTTRNILLLTLLLCFVNLGIGVYIGYHFFHCKSVEPKTLIDYWNPNYHTAVDSSNKELSNIKVDTLGFKNIKPKDQVIFVKEKPIPIQLVKCNTDSLLIILDSLKNQIIKIPITFLTSFENNPKLINGYFSKDTLSLGLFYPNGNSSKSLFEVDYDNYRYIWINNNLKAERIPNKVTNQSISNTFSNIYINSGIISYTQSLFLNAEYEFHWKKIKVETTAAYLFKPNIPLITLGVGYKIK